MSSTHFDFIVIGGGSGGIPIAQELATSGKKVALFERRHLGGSCINFGCTPTKSVISSAKLAYDARRAWEFGLRIPQVDVRFSDVINQARQLVLEERKFLATRFQNRPGLTLIKSQALLEGRDEKGCFKIRGGDLSYTADQVILNTGSKSMIPPIEGLDPFDVLTAENWLEVPELPQKVVFLGSGYIGLEMGQFYRRMGAEVTLISEGSQIVKREDADVASAIQGFLQTEGIQFRLNTHLVKVAGRRGRYRLTTTSGVIDATHLFVSAGRQGNSANLGLETLGITPVHNGFLECDERLSTRVKGLWLAGDIRGGPMFTHTAWDDFRILKSQLLGDGARTTRRLVPYAVFVDPELGRVGLTEREAKKLSTLTKKSELEPVVSYFKYADNLKSREMRESRGFIKLIVDPKTEQLLGASVLGWGGGELVQIYSTLMAAHAPYSVIRDEIMIHPTLGEAIQSAVSAIPSVAQDRKTA